MKCIISLLQIKRNNKTTLKMAFIDNLLVLLKGVLLTTHSLKIYDYGFNDYIYSINNNIK